MQHGTTSIPDASILPAWRKSSYSGGESGDCLEVNDSVVDAVPVRDSKVPNGPAVVFGSAAWGRFVDGLK
ncbi:DUF397 domain-containing protein [Streptomyces sp. NPDC056144]|uniref:DUF397 domain-containing protein n=1 Tax=unclassified Streptomyces TaxID=2593676 RepID=UPI0035E287AE